MGGSVGALAQPTVGVQFGFCAAGHPERSRFSGEAKDLPLNRPSAKAKLTHYQTAAPGGRVSKQVSKQTFQPSSDSGKVPPMPSERLLSMNRYITHPLIDPQAPPFIWELSGIDSQPTLRWCDRDILASPVPEESLRCPHDSRAGNRTFHKYIRSHLSDIARAVP